MSEPKRGRGRPPKPPGEKYVRVACKLPPEIAAIIAEIGGGSIHRGAVIVLSQHASRVTACQNPRRCHRAATIPESNGIGQGWPN